VNGRIIPYFCWIFCHRLAKGIPPKQGQKKSLKWPIKRRVQWFFVWLAILFAHGFFGGGQ
jgi:hypothetical protein